jgi:hypothetical protein
MESYWAGRQLNPMKTLIAVTLAAASAFAQTATQSTTPELPAISLEKRAAYWRAIAEDALAQSRAAQTHAAVEAVITQLRKDCGERQLIADDKGEPTCAALPKEAPKPAK